MNCLKIYAAHCDFCSLAADIWFDDDDNDATGIQSTYGRPPFTLPATLPVTRIFPTTLPDPYPKSKTPTRHSLDHVRWRCCQHWPNLTIALPLDLNVLF